MRKILAYVLISLTTKNAGEILEKILKLKDVEEAKIIFGEWDILIKVKERNTEELSTFVLDKIRSMPEVKLTSTLIVAK